MNIQGLLQLVPNAKSIELRTETRPTVTTAYNLFRYPDALGIAPVQCYATGQAASAPNNAKLVCHSADDGTSGTDIVEVWSRVITLGTDTCILHWGIGLSAHGLNTIVDIATATQARGYSYEQENYQSIPLPGPFPIKAKSIRIEWDGGSSGDSWLIPWMATLVWR